MDESQIFTNALKLAAPAERAAYLDAACAGDPRLRAGVEALLGAHLADAGFLEQPADAPDRPVTPTVIHVPAGGPGDRVGPYKLLERIGEGGMGEVWAAEQTEPVRRKVAVKLIKAGMDSRQVLARFEAERQALALMDHPNIARVLDAGAAPDGRPYFVMELVKGRPITAYCDEHRLTARQRLELFVPVCQAIQHAHQKGVIHRDIKPSNVLVARYDERPVPKVIDFGVAKATGQALTEKTLHTGFGAVVGTPEYMSPEQASFNQLDVDTRSDIYSLGVLLYELLAGSPPFTRKDLERVGLLEILRVIREQEPPRPSTRLSTADRLPALAASRGTEPRRLTAQVRGELDWIVMKALDKDRNRRYDTANGFAMDVQRYLDDEAVQACPPSAGYRLRKFVRRNRASVLAAGLVLAVMLLAIAGLAVSNVLIGRARQDAVVARDDAGEKRDLALRAVEDMWVGFAEKWLRDEPGLEQAQREFVEKALAFYERLAREEADDPDRQAAVGTAQFRVAVIHDRLGAIDKGAAAYRRAADIFGRLAEQSPGNAEYRYWQARSLAEHGELADRAGRGPEAEALARRAMEIFEKAAADFPDDVRVRAGLADCCLIFGSVNYVPGPRINALYQPEWASESRVAECLRLLPRALELYPSVIAREPGKSDHRWRFHRAQKILSQMPNVPPAERERLARASVDGFVALTREFPREHRPRTELCEALGGRGTLCWYAGRPAEEEAADRQALAIADQLAADYPTVPYYRKLQGSARRSLGMHLTYTERPAEAEPLLAQAAAALEAVPEGIVPPVESWHEAARCYEHLGYIRVRAGRFDEAAREYRKAIALDLRVARVSQIAPTWRFLDEGCRRLVMVGIQAGRPDDAVRAYRDVAAFWKQLADAHPNDPQIGRCHAMTLNDLGVTLVRLGRREEADREYAAAQAIFDRFAPGSPDIPGLGSWSWLLVNRAWLRVMDSRPDEAVALWRERVEWFRRRAAAAPGARPADRYQVATAQWNLADYLDYLARPPEAVEAAYREAIAAFDRLAGEVPGEADYRDDAIAARFDLAFVFQQSGRTGDANRLADEAVAIGRRAAASDGPTGRGRLAVALSHQGLLRWRTGPNEAAAAARDEAAALLNELAGAALTGAGPLTNLAEVSSRCARLFEYAGRPAEAEAALRQEIALRERAAGELSHDQRANIRRRAAWGRALADLSRFHLRQKQAGPAARRCSEALAVYEQTASNFPVQSESLSHFAFFLAACPVEALRDPARAAQVAERAVATSLAEDPVGFRAMGAARYRLGDHRAAVDHLDRAVRVGNGRAEAEDLFYRAMARWKLGEKEAARRDYDEGVRLTTVRLQVPDDDKWSELQQIREEAAALLGVK